MIVMTGTSPPSLFYRIYLEIIMRIHVTAGNVNIAHTGGCIIIYRYFDTYLLCYRDFTCITGIVIFAADHRFAAAFRFYFADCSIWLRFNRDVDVSVVITKLKIHTAAFQADFG